VDANLYWEGELEFQLVTGLDFKFTGSFDDAKYTDVTTRCAPRRTGKALDEPRYPLAGYATGYHLSAKFQIMIARAANVPSRWAAEIRAWS
jgi:hypothetical protein